jgi:hypothetical protein
MFDRQRDRLGNLAIGGRWLGSSNQPETQHLTKAPPEEWRGLRCAWRAVAQGLGFGARRCCFDSIASTREALHDTPPWDDR